MKKACSMTNLHHSMFLDCALPKCLDDQDLELKNSVYHRVVPAVALRPQRVVPADLKEMKLSKDDVVGFGYNYYDFAQGLAPINLRAIKFGSQDACHLRTEVHSLKKVLLKSGESFRGFISEGGSGAKPYVVQLSNGERILRKLMLQGNFGKQNEEAEGEEFIRGFGQGAAPTHDANESHAPLHEDARIAKVLSDTRKVALLQQFIRDTRPDYYSRYMVTLREPNKELIYASFFDQQFVEGCDFSQAIANNNKALSVDEIDSFVQAQIGMLNRFYSDQAKIFLKPVEGDVAKKEMTDYYLKRLNDRILAPLKGGAFERILLSLNVVDGQDEKLDKTFTLKALFSEERVLIDGELYDNPIPKLPALITELSSPFSGWSMHGDPQQTNFLFQGADSPNAPDRKAHLLCIDNRPAKIVPYAADLEKAVWGAGWVPLFQGYIKPRLSVDVDASSAFSFAMSSDAASQNVVSNFQRFEGGLQKGLDDAQWYQELLRKDAQLPKRVMVASVTQSLCDIGIAVKRLEQAQQAIVDGNSDLDLKGTQQLIGMLNERIVGDFLLACLNYAKIK